MKRLFFSTMFMVGTHLTSGSLLTNYHVDFDLSMEKGTQTYQKKYKGGANRQRLQILKKLYQKNNFLKAKPTSNPKIPYIIHQIWVGDAPVPKTYKEFKQTWLKHHPGWDYKLWTNKEVSRLKLINQAYYDAATHPAEKANILRYELLYRYGGVYCDIDFRCLKSLKPLHHRYDFYTGIEPNDSDHVLNNALIGCSKGHKILEHTINTIAQDSHKKTRFERNGVDHFSRCFVESVDRALGTTIALPSSYFYPLKLRYGKKEPVACLKQESFAVHYWANRYGSNVPKLSYKR